jgi:hypothetical protein
LAAAKGKQAEKKKGIGGIIVISAICVLLLLIVFAVLVVMFNALGIRDRYLTGILKDVPFVRNLLPSEAAEGEPGEENGENGENGYIENGNGNGMEDEDFEEWAREELIERLYELTAIMAAMRAQLRVLEADLEGSGAVSAERLAEINRLREQIEELQEMHELVMENRREFDRMISEGDPRAYQSFFESIFPEWAGQLYQDAVRHNIITDEITNYIATFNRMDEGEAAGALETMMATEINLVVDILRNMTVSKRSSILNEFSSADNRARILIAMAPSSMIH